MNLVAILGASLLVGTLGGPGVDGLVGTWTCTGATGSRETWTFTRKSPALVSLVAQIQGADGSSTATDESYRLDARTRRWSWDSRTNAPGGLRARGNAGPWNSDDSWTFDGSSRGGVLSPGPIRMMFTNLTEHTFHREIDAMRGDQLFQQSASACSRNVSSLPNN